MRLPPEPQYERDIQRLVTIYQTALKQLEEYVRRIPDLPSFDYLQTQMLIRQIEDILRGLGVEVRSWVQNTFPSVFEEGVASSIYVLEGVSLARAIELAKQFATIHRSFVEAMIDDTFNDLLAATQRTEQQIKKLVREAVADHLRVNAAQSLGRRTSQREIIDTLTKAGLSRTLKEESWKGIVDAAGRRWNLSTYVEMVVRTKLRDAHTEGVRREALQRNVDLAIISSHGAKDACRMFEGLVISLNGLTPGYRTYRELRASNLVFHPNCKHYTIPIRNLDMLPESVRQKALAQRMNSEKALREWADKKGLTYKPLDQPSQTPVIDDETKRRLLSLPPL